MLTPHPCRNTLHRKLQEIISIPGRYRHEPYWSLRMRVCRLCVEANTLSADELHRKYGVDYSDYVCDFKNKVFVFTLNTPSKDDRLSIYYKESGPRQTIYLFWKPHLEKFLDLPALCQQQKRRKAAAVTLSAVLSRRYILHMRLIYGGRLQHHSIDSLLLALRRNERARHPHCFNDACLGGPFWAFTERSHKGQCKFTARSGKPVVTFNAAMQGLVDSVVV